MTDAVRTAAAKLAGELQLSSWEGCVWVRSSDGNTKIMVAVDDAWLRRHRPVPTTYMGFQVEVSPRLSPRAGARIN